MNRLQFLSSLIGAICAPFLPKPRLNPEWVNSSWRMGGCDGQSKFRFKHDNELDGTECCYKIDTMLIEVPKYILQPNPIT